MNERPNSLHASDAAHSMNPYSNMRAHEEKGPTIITRSDGIRVYDSEGKQFIEAMAGLWSVAVGFSENRLRRALDRAFDVVET